MAILTAFYILLFLSVVVHFENDAIVPMLQQIMPSVINTIKKLGGQVVLLQACCWLWITYAIAQSTPKTQGY